MSDGTVIEESPMIEDEPTGGIRDRAATIFVILVAVALIIGAIVVVPHFISGGSGRSSQPQLATAAIRSFPVAVSTDGTVVPASEIPVNFTSSGRLAELDVQVGQKVTRGTVLAKQDATVANSNLASAQATVTSAQAQLAAAQNPLDAARRTQLTSAVTSAQGVYNQTVASVQATAAQDAAVISTDKQQLVTDQQRLSADGCGPNPPYNAQICQSDQAAIVADQGRLQIDTTRSSTDANSGQVRISQAQSQIANAQAALTAASAPVPSQVAAAQAAVSSAQSQFQAAQAALAALTLQAPSDGTVLQINGQVGETVSASATGAPTLPGTNAPIPQVTSTNGTGATTGPSESGPLVMLGNSTSFVIGAPFPSSDVQQLATNQTCTVTANTLGGLSLPCRVLAVGQDATVVNGTSVVWVSAIPTGPTNKLSTGLTVSVNVNVSQANNVLAVPQSSIYLLGGVPHVDVWNGKRPVSTVVGTGLQGDQLIQITSGLSAGEQVVLTAYQGLPQTATTVSGLP